MNQKYKFNEHLDIVHHVFNKDFLKDKDILKDILYELESLENSQDHEQLENLKSCKDLVQTIVNICCFLNFVSCKASCCFVNKDWKAC